jgi:flagellar hook-associated protein 2
VTSNVLDTTNVKTTNLDYNNSSDISTLANLGVTVSQSDDGTLSFDASVLDSALNADYSGVLGFFQNANSWGQSFTTLLENAGTTAGTGVLALASASNSSIESSLNANISKENLEISAQQSSLTAELNSANEIMQELPAQLQGVNELYSAISGYDQNSNG